MNAIDVQPALTANPLDRMDHLRDDIFNKRNPASDKYLLLSQGNILLSPDKSCFMTANALPDGVLNDVLCVFLGGCENHFYFALSVTAEQAENYESLPLREFMIENSMHAQQLGILAEANSLLSWHHSHGFCARCGAPSIVAHGGWRRDCLSCEAKHFPRIDPAVIMLVTHGDHCLLGRSPHFQEKRFSCLAGFMEPGETIEQAALRELWEEAGIRGESVRYLFDQPWPFPANLMIGVHIEAQSRELNIDYNELENAMWISKSEVAAVFAGATDRDFLLPPTIAVARSLLEYWLKA